MSTSPKKFRTAVNGYKKEDVNEYIQNENRRFSDIEKEHLDKIDELLDKLDDLQNKLNVSNDLLVSKDDEINSLLTENQKQKEDLVLKNQEISKSEYMIAELETRINAINDENNALTSELSELREKEKSGAYSPSSEDKSQITDMIFRARNASEDMLKRAEEGATILLGKAKDEVNICRSEAVSAAKEIFDAATEELRRSIGICMNDFVSAIRKAKNDPERTDSAADFCDDDLGRRIERMQNDLDLAIAEKLAEFENKR